METTLHLAGRLPRRPHAHRPCDHRGSQDQRSLPRRTPRNTDRGRRLPARVTSMSVYQVAASPLTVMPPRLRPAGVEWGGAFERGEVQGEEVAHPDRDVGSSGW